MGIKNLNRFLKENCTKNAIRKIKLHQIKNKIVVTGGSGRFAQTLKKIKSKYNFIYPKKIN